MGFFEEIAPILGTVAVAFGGVWGAVAWAVYRYFSPRPKVRQTGTDDPTHSLGSSYGNPIPIVWGRVRVGTQVIWTSQWDNTNDEVDIALLVCDTQDPYGVDSVSAIWAGETLIWNGSLIDLDPDTGGNQYAVDTTTGSVTVYKGENTQAADGTMEGILGTGYVPAYRGRCIIVLKDFELGLTVSGTAIWGGRIPAFTVEVIDKRGSVVGDAPYISAVVKNIAGLVGLDTTNDLDTGDIDLELLAAGVFILGKQPARQVIEQLMQTHKFDLVELGGASGAVKITAIDKGDASAYTIAETELGAGPPGSKREKLELERAHDWELPEKATVSYWEYKSISAWAANTAYKIGDVIKPTGAGNGHHYYCKVSGTSHATTEPTWANPETRGASYTDNTVTWIEDGNDQPRLEQQTQGAFTQVIYGKGDVNLDLPMILSNNTARQAAETLLHEAWAARTRYRFSTSWARLAIAPGDIVTVQFGSESHLIRIERQTIGLLGEMVHEGVSYHPGVYTQYGTGGTGP